MVEDTRAKGQGADMLVSRKAIQYEMYVSFIAIPVLVIMFYGLEDDNEKFFNYGKGVRDQFETIYHKKVYHYGVMVSDAAAIAVLSIVFGLISLIVNTAILEKKEIEK